MRSTSSWVGRFALFFSFVLLLSPLKSHSDESCIYGRTLYGGLQFSKVEMLSRNHDVVLYVGAAISLKPWIEVAENAYLGIDKNGRVLNVVKTPERTVAFLLSGKRIIKDLFFRAPGDLLAIDQDGRLLSFDRPEWAKSPLKRVVARGALRYTGLNCAVGLGYSWLYFQHTLAMISPDTLGLYGFVLAGGAMIEVRNGMGRIDDLNQLSDGFKSTGQTIADFRMSEIVFADNGSISDYLLRARNGAETSLNALIGSDPHNGSEADFHSKCEYELL